MVPSWDLLLGDGVVANTSDTGLGAARATGQLLIAPVLTKATTITGADIAEIAALTGLGGMRNWCYRGGTSVDAVLVVLAVVATVLVRTRLAIARRSIVEAVLSLSLGRLMIRRRRTARRHCEVARRGGTEKETLRSRLTRRRGLVVIRLKFWSRMRIGLDDLDGGRQNSVRNWNYCAPRLP